MRIGNHLYITIFTERHQNDIHSFETLVHEVVHARGAYGKEIERAANGKEFTKVGKEVLAKLRKNVSIFSEPYCHVLLNDEEILSPNEIRPKSSLN